MYLETVPQQSGGYMTEVASVIVWAEEIDIRYLYLLYCLLLMPT